MEKELEVILKCKLEMEQIPESIRTNDYSIIYHLIKQYARIYCNHHVVTDLIDIDPDHSMEIKYCCICDENIPNSNMKNLHK